LKKVEHKLISRNTGKVADASTPRIHAQYTTAACTVVVHVHKGMAHTQAPRTHTQDFKPQKCCATTLYTIAYMNTLAASLASGATAATWPAASPSAASAARCCSPDRS
jgi:hypothetical protein